MILQGPTGAGKTYVACALGNKACQQYRSVLYLSASELFDKITIAERTDQKKRCLDTLVELLITGDWSLTTPSRQQVQQLTPDQWRDRLDEKILADVTVDPIVTNARATVLECDDSMRKQANQIN